MSEYNRIPGIDANNNMNPAVRSALANSPEMRAAIIATDAGRDTILSVTLTAGQTYVLDPTKADQFILTLTGNATLSIPTYSVGQRFLVQINQDAVGGRVLTLPPAVGATFSLATTANTYELLVYRCWTASRLDVVHPNSNAVSLPTGPGTISDGLLWLDGSLLAGDEGDDVSSWINSFTSSPLPAIVASSAGTAIPKLHIEKGVPVIDLDGINDYMGTGALTANIAQPMTMFALFKTDGSSAVKQAIFSGGASGSPMLYVETNTAAGNQSHIKLHAGTTVNSTVVDDGTWTIVWGIVNGGTSKIKVDETPTVTAAAGAGVVDAVRIGRTNGTTGTTYFAGQIAMFVLIGHVSSSNEIDAIVSVMQAKKNALEA